MPVYSSGKNRIVDKWLHKWRQLEYNTGMSMIRITSNSREYLKALGKIPKAMQAVTAATLTETAQSVTTRGERNLKRTMIVRAPYTTRSLRTYKASASKPIERQDAVSGTISEYLPVHDKGGTIKAKKRKIAVPTNRVRGVDRKKKITSRYRIDKLQNAFTMGPGKIRKRPGLFIRTGKKGKIVKVRDLGGSSYKMKARLWHTEAVKKYGNYSYMAQVFRRQAQRYLGVRTQ